METNGNGAHPTAKRPPAYRVDAPLRKVQSLALDGDEPYLFRHDLIRLDASNFQLLKQHENDTVRVSEQVAKGQYRKKHRSVPADANLYKALIKGGGWRFALWEPCRDKELIPTAATEIYAFDEESKMWKPGWFELEREQMINFNAFRQSQAIENMMRAAGEYIKTTGLAIDFMFEKSGLMRVRLLVGERESPAYRLLMDIRRPDSKRSIRFSEDFAYGVEHTPQPGKKNDLGKVETKIDNDAGVSLFDEYFSTVIDDPAHSLVVFGEELDSDNPSDVRVYQDSDRADFLARFDPNYKLELAATVVSSFSKTDRELSTA